MRVKLTEKGKKALEGMEIPEEVKEKFESIFHEGNLVMFMTYGMSLKKWKEMGILERELKPYRELKKYLKSVSIVTYGDWTEPYIEGMNIFYNNTALPDFLYTIFAPWIHRRFMKDADYFKVNQVPGSWTATIAKMIFGKKLFIRQGYPWLQTLQEKKAPVWKRILAGLTENIVYGAADGIIVTMEQDKLQIQNNHTIPANKIHVIPNYIDTNLFKPAPETRIENRLLYVGRLEPEKNLINVIKAVKGLDVELIIIGDGSMKHQLETLVNDEGIQNVKFLGRVPNESLPEEYNKAELYVQVSEYEGNPKTVLEAMACGSIVIGSHRRGIRDLIIPEKTGFLCGTETTCIRLTVLSALLFTKGSKYTSEHMRKRAREEIVENYSLKKVVLKELWVLRERPDLE